MKQLELNVIQVHLSFKENLMKNTSRRSGPSKLQLDGKRSLYGPPS